MSGKLDQALDDIVKTNRSKTRHRARRVKPTKTTATVAPAGGVRKTTKSVKPTKTGTGPTSGPKESKIQVSGLPHDVSEGQIKEYFGKTIGSIKRVMLTYNKNGVSVGVATIIFRERDAASQAAKQLNGTRVDNRPMRIEVLMDADSAPGPAAAKSLADRVVANPKAQPKSAVAAKTDKRAGTTTGGRVKRGRAAGRPKRKTAEELDADMADYFGDGTPAAGAATEAGATNGTVAQGGDAMDEIS